MTYIQSTTISSRNQTVVPSFIRKRLRLFSGDKIYWRVINRGDQTVALAQPASHNIAKSFRGISKDIWKNTSIKEYINNLRHEWENKH